MSILLGLLIVLQTLTIAFLVRRFGLTPTEDTQESVTTVVNNVVNEHEQTVLERFLEIEEAQRELAEHVDNVVEIITSVAEEAAQGTVDLKHLSDRVSRNAYTLSETKNLLNKTIDNIDWEDSEPAQPVVYDPAAPVQPEVYQRPYIPPPPTPAPPQPVAPVPQPPTQPAVQPAHQPAVASSEVEPPIEQVPLVSVRGDNDPLITDLRAVPFQDHPEAYQDPYALPASHQYEEMGSRHNRASSRTNGLRQRYGR